MPRGDGTGPIGLGPMTGRAAGLCAGFAAPGFANPFGGRGMACRHGFGRGAGRGLGNTWRSGSASINPVYENMPPTAPIAEQPDTARELELMRKQSETMTRTLEDIQQRIESLEKSNSAVEQ